MLEQQQLGHQSDFVFRNIPVRFHADAELCRNRILHLLVEDRLLRLLRCFLHHRGGHTLAM